MTQARTNYLLALLALTALLAGMPSAAAQAIRADNANTDKALEPLVPELDSKPITLAFIYTFDFSPLSALGVTKATAAATLDVSCADPINIIVTGPRSSQVPINPQNDPQNTGTAEFEFELFISVTRELPGLKLFSCDYDVTVEAVGPNGQVVGESAPFSDSFTLSATFYGLIQSTVGGQIQKTGPQKEISFPINLKNFGNARTTVSFEIVERPGGKKWQAVVPDDVILDSPFGAGSTTEGTAQFQITTTYKNGWNNEQGSYRVGMNVYASDSPGQTIPDLGANVLVRVRGVYVPTLEPMIMLGAILICTLLVRARLEE